MINPVLSFQYLVWLQRRLLNDACLNDEKFNFNTNIYIYRSLRFVMYLVNVPPELCVVQ